MHFIYQYKILHYLIYSFNKNGLRRALVGFLTVFFEAFAVDFFGVAFLVVAFVAFLTVF